MLRTSNNQELYKAFGVLLRSVQNDRGGEWIADVPLCPDSTCHTFLEQFQGHWKCEKCDKTYSCPQIGGYSEVKRRVEKMWQGYKTLNYKVYSLDLPPTKVVDEAEDDNYWVQARISEKAGKRMAVIYFGEKVKVKQKKDDYTQIFIDLEDEQMRFDKSNKNPMKVVCKLTAEFPESTFELKKRGKAKKAT